jgi:outer membrane receptor protein involved in Fe transport
VARDFGGGAVPLKGAQYALYAGDQWQLAERLSLTLGMRADLLDINGRPPYNRVVDSIFGRRTDQRFARTVHLSPRVGFSWDPDGTGRSRLRGGAGIFTGRPPLAWLHMPFMAYGFGTGILKCGGGPANPGPAPLFQPDPLDPPVACAGGLGATPPGDVELIEPGLRMPSTLRANLAWDRWLTGNLLATFEALYTRNRSDILFVNLNLAGPQSVDGQGRTLYGVFDAVGRASPVLRARTLPGVIEARNVSANHSTQLSARLEKRFAAGSSLTAGYTWSRVRDVQTPLRVNNRGVVNWSSRAVSGRHEDLRPGISLNDIPHRIILAGTWRAPWTGWTTELSLLYVGESGSPFTYRAFGLRGLGDLNADGSTVNDPVYVPFDATDPAEISFVVDGQPGAFEQFIEDTPCLRRRRGRILERNSCREPWTHTSVISLRQRVPVRNRGVEVQLDLFNLLNLLDGDWGLRRVAEPALLEHVGQATGPGGGQRPVFRFRETASPWTVIPAESAYQLQLGLAYRF